MIQAFRVIRIGWVLQLKTMARSGFDVMQAIVTPIVYASIAFFLYRRGGGTETLLWVALGAAFMGLWASEKVLIERHFTGDQTVRLQSTTRKCRDARREIALSVVQNEL